MKKVLFTAVAAMAMFAMTACNNNKTTEATEDTTACAVEQCEHKCMHEGDSAAMCCKAEGMAEEAACEHKCEKACEHKCEKACEHKCDKAEGKECCKKAEGKECCKKAEGKECCKKAEGKECEHKCQK